jgi:hypothetical protein
LWHRRWRVGNVDAHQFAHRDEHADQHVDANAHKLSLIHI